MLNSKRAKTDRPIQRRLATKPRLVVGVALANQMARIAWAVGTASRQYRAVMVRQTGLRHVAAAA